MKNKITGLSVHISDKNPWTGRVFKSAAEVEQFHTAEKHPDGLFLDADGHKFGRGFRAAGYQFVIEADGNIWENPDRKLDGDAFITGDEQGAHTLYYNRKTIGVCFLAAPDEDGFARITAEQAVAFRYLARFLANRYQFSLNHIWGHRTMIPADHPTKSCPNISNETLRRLARNA